MRDQEVFIGSLPEFEVEAHKVKTVTHRGFLKVTCPRGTCKQTHIIKAKAWRASSDTIARPCPYCFKVSRIPKERANP